MDVDVSERGGLLDITIAPPAIVRPFQRQFFLGLSEHDLRDLVFVLEQRRAMGKTCPEKNGEHTCSMAPGHGPDPGHVCRACDLIWPGVG